MQGIQLIEAGVPDIPAIRELASSTWEQYYPAIISRQQIDYMLGMMYSEESLLEQMTEKKHQFYFIVAGGQQVGFISVYREKNADWFISKFYISQSSASKGVGSDAFEELKRITGAGCFRLTVNRQNYKAVNFYFKNGFRIERVADFDIGNGYVMNDFVMSWKSLPGPRQ